MKKLFFYLLLSITGINAFSQGAGALKMGWSHRIHGKG